MLLCGQTKSTSKCALKKPRLPAESVFDTVIKKTANPAEAVLVLKLALTIFEAYMRHQRIKFNTKEFDAYVSKFMKDFEKHLPNR